jgi:hypothetical protein
LKKWLSASKMVLFPKSLLQKFKNPNSFVKYEQTKKPFLKNSRNKNEN